MTSGLREEIGALSTIVRLQRLRRRNRRRAARASQSRRFDPARAGTASKYASASPLVLLFAPVGEIFLTFIFYLLIDRIADALGPGEVARAAAIVAAVTFALDVIGSLGLNNANLASLDSEVEWLMTLPVKVPTVYLAKVVESVVFRFGWVTIAPCYVAALWRMGYRFGAIPGGLLLAFVSSCASGIVGFALELTLRRTVSQYRLHAIQSAASVVTMVSYLAAAYGASHIGPAAAAARGPLLLAGSIAECLPTGPGLAAFDATTAAARIGFSALLAVELVASVAIGAAIISWASARGLEAAQTGRVGRRESSTERRSALSSVAAKELRMLARDKRLLTRVLLAMLGLVPTLFNLLRNSDVSLVERRGALALGVGVLALAVSAPRVIFFEGAGLWLLYTIPTTIRRVIGEKLRVWSAIAVGLAVSVLAVVAAVRRGVDASDATALVFAAVGLPAFAYLAAAIGVTFTNPLATDDAEKIRKSAQILPYLFAPLLVGGLYMPGVWAKVQCLGVFVALAYAWWDKAGTFAEYLLDPVSKPPAALYVADGLLAVAIYFLAMIQVTALLSVLGVPALASATVGIAIGGTVTVAAVGDVLRQNGAKLGRYVRVLGDTSRARVFATAVPAAAAAIAVAAVYLFCVRRLLGPDAVGANVETGPWLVVLTVVAAPIFEETLFRGLVLNGFLRTASPRVAVLATSALFALVHPGQSAVPVFCLAIAASVAYARTRALLTPILVHAAYNAAVLAMNAYAFPS